VEGVSDRWREMTSEMEISSEKEMNVAGRGLAREGGGGGGCGRLCSC
jgi:hypothetical protein